MNHISLFSGVGGGDLAAEWLGWNNVAHCEYEPNCKEVLKNQFPNSISYDDITKTDFTIHRGSIDVVSGGFPCQPFSAAGKRKGQEDDRFLWPEMLRAIREIEPRWIVAENVYGLLSIDRGYTVEMVCSDLENIGYEKPVIFDCTSDSVGLSTMERHIWIITKAVNFGCKRGVSSKDENKRNTEGEFSRSYKGIGDRRDISTTEFQRVGERVSNKLDKESKQRLIQMGNAFPPKMAYEIFKAIESYEKSLITI